MKTMTLAEGTVGKTLVAPLGGLEQRNLRSTSRKENAASDNGVVVKTNRKHHESDDEREKDRALELAEEKMLLDEEVDSYDETGRPVADPNHVDRRNLTVALVNSVVETSSGDHHMEEHSHSYGLRRRKRAMSGTDSPVPSSPPRKRSTVVRNEPQGGGQEDTTSDAASQAVVENSAQAERSQVPNPLRIDPASETKPAGKFSRNRAPSVSFLSLPGPGPNAASRGTDETRDSSGNEVTGVTRRGRIFSIDIDPAGLDFPDIAIDGTMDPQAVLHGSSSLASLHSAGGVDSQPTAAAPNAGASHPVASDANPISAKTNAVGPSPDMSFVHSGGRDRAMSFEFFSFGINADEPLPDGSGNPSNRPRGDSIIFDPASFRDGGILEENEMLRNSRTNSLDLCSGIINASTSASLPLSDASQADKVVKPQAPASAINPTSAKPRHPGAPLAAPPSTYSRPNLKPAAASTKGTTTTASNKTTGKGPEMAPLPSGLASSGASGGGLSHATFQMELLNKDGRIGIYLPEARRARIAKFHSKRKMRIWRKRIKYDCRKKLADSRPRIKGRFVKRSDMEE